MPIHKQATHGAEARALFAEGRSIVQIAEAMGVAASTISRWRDRDAKALRPWAALREERRLRDPTAVLATLERKFLAVAEGELSLGAKIDALYKLDRIIQNMRSRVGDLPTVLAVFTGFAEWAGAHAAEEDIPVLHRLVEGYLSALKRRAT